MLLHIKRHIISYQVRQIRGLHGYGGKCVSWDKEGVGLNKFSAPKNTTKPTQHLSRSTRKSLGFLLLWEQQGPKGGVLCVTGLRA